MRSTRLAVAALGVVAVVVSGCSAPSATRFNGPTAPSTATAGLGATPESPTPEPSTDPLLRPTGVPVSPVVVEPVTARTATADRDFTAEYTVPSGWIPLALTGDGFVVAGADSAGTAPIGSYDGQRFRPFAGTPVAVPGDGPRRVVAASAADGVVVWSEVLTGAPGSWRIFARDAQGRSQLVARSEDLNAAGLPVLDGSPAPVAVDGRVYWATAAPITPGAQPNDPAMFRMDVYSRAIDGTGAARREVVGAAHPAVGDHGWFSSRPAPLYVSRSAVDDPTVEVGDERIERADGDRNSTVLVKRDGRAGARLTSLVADAGNVAFVATAPSELANEPEREQLGDPRTFVGGVIYVLLPGISRIIGLPLPDSGASTRLAMCGDRLVWTGVDPAGKPAVYVFDVASRDLARIDPGHPVTAPYCFGELIGWSGSTGDTSEATVARWAAAKE